MGRDTIQLEDFVSTISGEYLLEFTSEYGILEDLHPELPGPEDTIVDFSEGKVEMDLFNLISAPNPAKVKTGTRPCAAHEMPLLTTMANHVIDMEDTTGASGSSGTPSTVEKSPLDFADEDLPLPNTKGVVLEPDLEQEVAAIGPLVHKRRRRRSNDEADANAPPKVLRKDHVAFRPSQSTIGGKSLATMGKAASSTITPAAQDTLAGASSVKDPDPLSSKKTVVAKDPDSERSTSFTSMGGSPGSVYQPGWGVTNNCRLDTLDVCQDVVYHIAPPGVFLELCQLPNDKFLNQHNINLTRQVAMGSKLRLKFEQKAKLLKKSIAQVARQDQRIEAKEKQIKNLEALLEAEADMKNAVEAKNAELVKELECLRSQFSDLQLSNQQLSQQVSTLQAQITSEEKIKSAFEEFKKYEDDRVEQHCVEMDARLDKLSVDFDEELYPHMLTAIAGRRWVIGHDLRLAVKKCGETPELRQAFANAGRDLEAVEAYDPESHSKYLKALQELKDLKYPLVDQLEGLKDAPMELIIAIKEQILMEDAIAANISRAEKKKKCRVVCRTHGIGSTHHAISDGIHVSAPTVVPQGLAILLANAATQTEAADKEKEPHPRLQQSISLSQVYNL
ncbi:hypothetical protein Tco_1156955 [Tanacetum coccineum]